MNQVKVNSVNQISGFTLKGVGYGIQFTRNLVNSISKELAIIMHWQKPLNVLKIVISNLEKEYVYKFGMFFNKYWKYISQFLFKISIGHQFDDFLFQH